jgi:23S rRNA (guanosine2251-2'-O)-methyltransferase
MTRPRSGGTGRGSGSGRPAARSGGRSAPPGRGGRPARAAGGAADRSRRRPDADGQRGARPTVSKGLGGEQVEGRQAVRELLLARRRRAFEIWFAADLDRADILDDIRELAASQRVPIIEVSRKRLDGEARTDAAQGVLAKAASLPESDLADLLRRRPGQPAPFLVLLDGVTDPGNVGAIVRTAECAGVTGIVLPKHRAAHVTPTVAKAAQGAVEYVPMALVSGIPAAIGQLQEAGVWVLGLDGTADRTLFDVPDLGPSDAVAVVMGAEGSGLSRLTRERCDELLALPMFGSLSSLNVSAAAALACFEIARRRA